MKYKRIVPAVLIAATLLFGACSGTELDYSPPNKNYLKICSWNIEDFSAGSVEDPQNYATTAYLLRTNGIDVVGFQELQPGASMSDTYGDGSVSSFGDTVSLNKALATENYVMPYIAYSTDGGFRNDYTAVWSRFPVTDATSVDPSSMQDPSTGVVYGGYRAILRFKIRFQGRDIWFYNAHLKSNAGGTIEYNMGRRRAQAYHLANYIKMNHDPVNDLIVIMGDMNTMPDDYDGSGNSTMDYLCLKHDNPYNTANDFIPVNLKHIGAITNDANPTYDGSGTGNTHPGSAGGYPDATFDHIILSPALYNNHYVQGSVAILPYADSELVIDNAGSANDHDGPADHRPVVLILSNF